MVREWSLISTKKSSGHLTAAYTQGKVIERNEAEWFKSKRWEDASWARVEMREVPSGYEDKSLHHQGSQTEEEEMSAEMWSPSLEAFKP